MSIIELKRIADVLDKIKTLVRNMPNLYDINKDLDRLIESFDDEIHR